MRMIAQHRGVQFSIPHSDDGIWHYKVHAKRDKVFVMRGSPQQTAPAGYPSREAAIAAAKQAIDAWLARPSG